MNNLILTGKKLKTYVDNMDISDQTPRNFVKGVLHYCKSNCKRILMVSGLKGTGKTVGVLHSIRDLNDYDNTVYISFYPEDKVLMSDLYKIINRYKRKKYVFVDEATVIEDLAGGVDLLNNKYIREYGLKLVLSGPDPLLLYFLNADSLYRGFLMIKTTFISYKESVRIANFSFMDYLEMGGLYKADSIVSIEKLGVYLDIAVVDTIYNTISKSQTKYAGKWNRDEIKTAVYKILYAVIFSQSKDISFHANRGLNLYDWFEVIDSQRWKILSDLGVVDYALDRCLIDKIINSLKIMKIIIEISNLADPLDKKYFVSNPSIVNIVYSSIVEEFNWNSTEQKTGYNQVLELVFKSAVMCHASFHVDKKYNNVFYYRRNDQEEIDLVEEIVDENPNKDSVFHLYKVEFTDNDTDTKKRADWLFKEEIAEDFQNIGILGDRKIVYLGSTKGLLKNGEEFLLERS